MVDTRPRRIKTRRRAQLGMGIAIFGLVIFIFGINPGLFRMDRSPVVGFIQIAVFLIGLGIICLGGYIALNALWYGMQKTIAADIGFRLVATGYVVAATSGMADVFGFGTQPFPNIPFFGLQQAIGVLIGEIIIVLGFILLIPFPDRS